MWFQPLTKINNAASPKLHFFVFQLPNYVVLKKTRAWLFASKNVPQKIPFLFQLIRSSWNFFDKPSQLLYIDIDFDYPSNQNKQRKKNTKRSHSTQFTSILEKIVQSMPDSSQRKISEIFEIIISLQKYFKIVNKNFEENNVTSQNCPFSDFQSTLQQQQRSQIRRIDIKHQVNQAKTIISSAAEKTEMMQRRNGDQIANKEPIIWQPGHMAWSVSNYSQQYRLLVPRSITPTFGPQTCL